MIYDSHSTDYANVKFKPLTLDSVPIDGFYFDGEDVRSAVIGFNKEYCYCHDLFNDGVIGNETPYCSVCADIRKWFPVFFEDVDESGVQE